ncbi:MAG: ABC-type transport auxiliary lipoprotein family protein [Betaproteobacteria bacterium]|nr:ABC-type transport auxiliary lipoprotein family protein [Betaproteobacteria bacterium]
MSRTLLLLSVLLLAACASLGDGVHQVYVLEDRMPGVLAPHATRPEVLRVQATRSNSYDDNPDLVFSRAPGVRGHYRYAQWSELPSTRMSDLLFARLAASQLYATVLDGSGDGSAQRRLTTTLLAFYHDARAQPGQAVIRVRAELYDVASHRLLARAEFTQTAPLARYDAAGAAAAFDRAESGLLDQLERWLAGVSAAAG